MADSSTRLHAAALAGQLKKIKTYLRSRDEVDAKDAEGRTALVNAIAGGQVEAVQLLLDSGADPSTRDNKSFFALYITAEMNDVAIAKKLIAAGCDVDALLIGMAAGGTALSRAACKNHKEMVQLLIDSGCDINKSGAEGLPPICDAAGRGHNEIVNMLHQAGADVNIVGYNNVTPLVAAALGVHCAVVANLISKGANVDFVAADGGYTTLHRVASEGTDEVMKLLLDARAAVDLKAKQSESTPLHICATKGFEKCVWLLLCAKANVSAKDCQGYTPLHHSAEKGHIECIELLLSAGQDVNMLDNFGRTPLVLATLKSNLKAIDLLLDAGADPNKADGNKWNALFAASDINCLKSLIERGGSAKVIDFEGSTVLHYAGHQGRDTAIICALYKAGADPCARNFWGETAADAARKAGKVSAAKMMDLLAAKHRSSA